MKYRVLLTFANGKTATLDVTDPVMGGWVAEIFGKTPEVASAFVETDCPEHGWSAVDAGACAECLDEYYHPQCEEECV